MNEPKPMCEECWEQLLEHVEKLVELESEQFLPLEEVENVAQ